MPMQVLTFKLNFFWVLFPDYRNIPSASMLKSFIKTFSTPIALRIPLQHALSDPKIFGHGTIVVESEDQGNSARELTQILFLSFPDLKTFRRFTLPPSRVSPRIIAMYFLVWTQNKRNTSVEKSACPDTDHSWEGRETTTDPKFFFHILPRLCTVVMPIRQSGLPGMNIVTSYCTPVW